MYLGGDVVNADECDFDSYKKLGLVCPFCNEAVFLRAGFIGKRGSKSVDIPACFSHFPTSKETMEDCERRSLSKEGRAEIERIKTEARNQRLELYNKHLWEMISTALEGGVDHGEQAYQCFVQSGGKRTLQAACNVFRVQYRKDIDKIHSYLKTICCGLFDREENLETFLGKEYTASSIPSLRAYSSKEFHLRVCLEVADFLCKKTSGYAFRHISYSVMLHGGMLAAEGVGFYDGWDNCIYGIANILSLVEWEKICDQYLNE